MNNAEWLVSVQSRFSNRLRDAIAVGMVKLQVDDERRSAWILPPSNADKMTDDDWLVVIRAVSKVRGELEQLGFHVKG